jgi:O-antigen biosynthesis protein
VQGGDFRQTEQDVVLEEELRLARGADRVVTVSRAEHQMYIDHGYNDVQILGHTVPLTMTAHAFKQRRDILFVGAFSGMESPNTDSMIWFVEKILPLIRAQLDEPFKFIIAGNRSHRELHSLQHETVDVLGTVEDLTELYDACRVFVVPTRYCAGIPYKAHHAAAHGIPLVVTGLIGGQLGWVHEQDVLIADSAEDFAAQCVRLYRDEDLWNSLRNCAAERIKKECSHEAFVESVRTIIA